MFLIDAKEIARLLFTGAILAVSMTMANAAIAQTAADCTPGSVVHCVNGVRTTPEGATANANALKSAIGRTSTADGKPVYYANKRTLAPPAVQTEEERKRVLEELRRRGLSESELAGRRAVEPIWAVGRERALQNLLEWMASAPFLPNVSRRQNDSAGYPTYFVAPPETDPQRYTAQAQALTVQMARRNLMALQEALTAATRATKTPQ